MKYFLTVVISAMLAGASQAFGLDLFKKGNDRVFDYSAWCDTTELAEKIDGRELFYPATIGGEASVSGEIKVSGLSAEKIFLAALDHAIDHMDATDGHEQIGEIDPDEKSFVLRRYSRQGSNNSETVFTCLTLIKAEEGRIRFRDTEIDVKYREKGLIPRTVAFEKLNPATNSRHRELVELFADISSKYLYAMAVSIPESKDIEVTHWKEINDKEIVKGMNRFEVKLILGRPVTERDNGDRIRWVYPKNYVLLFVDDKLSRIVE